MSPPTDVELQQLAGSLGAALLARNATLVTAESCTGGWIAKACTDVSGSSAWFLGGVVAYANALKMSLLDVPQPTLDQHGAVSEAVVRAMAVSALQRSGATLAVAVSGVAGPAGGTPAKPVGTVWLAWAERGPDGSIGTETQHTVFEGDREAIRRCAVRCALSRLLGA